MIIVGNDVVDLGVSLPTNKSQDSRFLQRVFTQAEQRFISASSNPELQLWLFWAAKETAYKIISKKKAPPVFSHKLFQVTIQSNVELSSLTQSLQIKYADDVIQSIGIWNNHKLHVVGYLLNQGSDDCAIRSALNLNIEHQAQSQLYRISSTDKHNWKNEETVNTYFSKAEQQSINHAASAIAKFKLKQCLAKKLNWDINQLEVIRPSLNKKMHPPFLLYKGHKTNVDISLSHHGDWVGWVHTHS